MGKKWIRHAFGLLATLAVVALADACAQDYTVRMQDQDGNISTHYITCKAVRDVVPTRASDVIYRLNQEKIITIDHKNKTYLEMSKSDIGTASTAPAASLTPEMREVVRTIGYKPAAATLTRVGTGNETIAGIAVEKYIATMPTLQDEVWIAPSLDVPADYYYLASASYVAQQFGVGEVFEALKESHIRGFVMRIAAHATVPTKTIVRFSQVAVSVQKGVIPASRFRPPAGYQKSRWTPSVN